MESLLAKQSPSASSGRPFLSKMLDYLGDVVSAADSCIEDVAMRTWGQVLRPRSVAY